MNTPTYADHLVLAAFQWTRMVSPFRPLADDDTLNAWLDRCLDLYGGLARRVKSFY